LFHYLSGLTFAESDSLIDGGDNLFFGQGHYLSPFLNQDLNRLDFFFRENF
jgi:hypothetical protein